jgi:site-specific recombinase XerC
MVRRERPVACRYSAAARRDLLELLKKSHIVPTVKQNLAAIRMLFDWLVTGQVVPSNPAHSQKDPKLRYCGTAAGA